MCGNNVSVKVRRVERLLIQEAQIGKSQTFP
jgi:hypothetical protein